MSNSGSTISEVQLRKQEISAAKKVAEIVTLREWYDSTKHGYELEEYQKSLIIQEYSFFYKKR